MAPPTPQRSERSGKPVALLWIATSRASLSEHVLEREDVEPAAELEGRLALAADADEAVTLVQPQRRLVVRDDARDHRVMIARARARLAIAGRARRARHRATYGSLAAR